MRNIRLTNQLGRLFYAVMLCMPMGCSGKFTASIMDDNKQKPSAYQLAIETLRENQAKIDDFEKKFDQLRQVQQSKARCSTIKDINSGIVILPRQQASIAIDKCQNIEEAMAISLNRRGIEDCSRGEYSAAAQCFSEAIAKYNSAQGYNSLGVLHKKGLVNGVFNYAEAIKCFKQAACPRSGGLVEAQNNLGQMYEEGLGVAKDDQAALIWYERAALQGFAVAQYNLGKCYERRKDYQLALGWYLLAAGQGYQRAKDRVTLIRSYLCLFDIDGCSKILH